MVYNPISLQIIRTSHNRSKDINNKYLNCIKGEMIQIIVPSDSKSYYNIQSKPKYGKLYYYNVYIRNCKNSKYINERKSFI